MTGNNTASLIIVAWLSTLVSMPAASEESGLERRVEELERKLEEQSLGDEGDDPLVAGATSLPSWVDRFHLSGNADFDYLHGEHRSIADDGRFAVENARFFLDVDVSGEARLFDRTVFESSSFFFEWDLVREASLKNEAGSLYARIDRIAGVDALNLEFGRFPIPFGEEYLRFHQDRPSNPLISYSAPAPYNWDEGRHVLRLPLRRPVRLSIGDYRRG